MTAEQLREAFDYNEGTGKFYHGLGGRFGREARSRQNRGYLKINIKGVSYLAHRLAWLYVHGTWPLNVIDHINGDKTDNRIINLRDVTERENAHAYLARVAQAGVQA